MFNKVIFFGKKNCDFTKIIIENLKKKSKKVDIVLSTNNNEFFKRKNYNRKYDYIFCFRSHNILKRNLLNKANYAAINFHPGTPEYRGIGCVNYALYENSILYGCTAHLIDEKIDHGKILDVRRFKIYKKDTIESVLKKTYKIQVKQANDIFTLLSKNHSNLEKLKLKSKNEKWSKRIMKKKYLEKFYEIKKNISKRKFYKKLRATYTKKFKPYVIINNHKFILEK